MKRFHLKPSIKGYKKNRVYVVHTDKKIKIGSINHNLKIFLNNRYILNKYLKANSRFSNMIHKNSLCKFYFLK